MRPDSSLCPEEVVESFRRYIDHGVPLGDFLQAVIENNLMEAFGRADEWNCEAMPHIAAWVYQNMPLSMRGRENYFAHLEAMRVLRESKQLDPPGS